MTPEIAVGLIGMGGALGGALLGGTATFAGVVYQQKHSAKRSDEERRTEMATQAADTILHQTQKLKELAWPTRGEEEFTWTQEMSASVETIRLASLRIPHKNIREPLEAACTFKFGASSKLRGDLSGVDDPSVRVVVTAGEVQLMLGAYLRGESVPSPEGSLGRALAAEEKLYRQIQQGRWSEI